MPNFFATFWAPGTTVHFRSLEFISTTEGTLVCVEVATKTAAQQQSGAATTALGCHSEQLWRYLDASLGSTPSRDDFHRVLFAFANVQGQLAGGEALSPRLLKEIPRPSYAHSTHNAARKIL